MQIYLKQYLNTILFTDEGKATACCTPSQTYFFGIRKGLGQNTLFHFFSFANDTLEIEQHMRQSWKTILGDRFEQFSPFMTETMLPGRPPPLQLISRLAVQSSVNDAPMENCEIWDELEESGKTSANKKSTEDVELHFSDSREQQRHENLRMSKMLNRMTKTRQRLLRSRGKGNELLQQEAAKRPKYPSPWNEESSVRLSLLSAISRNFRRVLRRI